MTRRLGAMVATFLSLATAGAAPDAAWLPHVRLYLPMDAGPAGPLAWHGTARREPMPFARPSPALGEDGQLVGDDEPRYVPGVAGTGIVYEGGHYRWESRGTVNYLAPAAAVADEAASWEAVGGVRVGTSAALVGGACLRATFTGEGILEARVQTPPIALEHLQECHLASVHLRRGAQQAENVRLTVLDQGLRFVAQSEPVTLDEQWHRLHVRFQLPSSGKPEDLRLVLTAAKGSVVDFDAAMVEQASRFYHDRRSPSSWVPGHSPRCLELTTFDVQPETLDPRSGAVGLWVRPLDEVTNSAFVALGAGWNVPLKLERNQAGQVSGYVGKTRLALGQAPAGQWHHVLLTWREGTAAGWLDGKQVAEAAYKLDELPDLASMSDRYFVLGIGHDDLGAFARSIGANAALDEVYLADQPPPPEVIDRLVHEPEQVAKAFAAPAVDTAGWRLAFGREEETATLPVVVHGPATQVEVRLDGRRLLSAAPPGDAARLELPLSPSTMEAGRHEVAVTVVGGGTSKTARRSITVGPYRRWDRFQVVGWNVAPEHYAAFRKMGGTVVNSQPDPKAAARAVGHGLWGMYHYTNRATPPFWAPAEQFTVKPDGSRGQVELNHPDVRSRGLAQAVADAEASALFPHLRLVLLNTEWHADMSFGPEAIRAARAATGLDLARWPLARSVIRQLTPTEIEAAQAGLGEEPPKGIEVVRPLGILSRQFLPPELEPRDQVVEPDHPLYRYVVWWHRERALASWNELLAKTFRSHNPRVEPLFDPILRGPSLRVYRDLAYGQEWVYYENPLRQVMVAEELQTACRGTAMRPTGMPQFLFKAGGAAPISVTPPRDLIIEATWLCCSRPIAMMTYWGWQLVFGPGDMWTPEQYRDYFAGLNWEQAQAKLKQDKPKNPHLWHPGALEAFETLGRTLFEPYGELISAWRNEPRSMAMVKSLASEVFGQERWFTAFRFGRAADGVGGTGLPYDILYDEDLVPDQLAGYDAVLLTAVEWLPRPGLEAIQAYAKGGGMVVAEQAYAGRVPSAVAVESWTPESVRAALAARPETLALLPEPSRAVVNALDLDGARFRVVVNDQREPGPLLGQWGKVAEQGVAHDVTVGVPAAAAYYELTESHPLAPAEGKATVSLPPAGGRIIGCYPQRLTELRAMLKRDAGALTLTVEAVAEAGAFTGPVPIQIKLIRPDGQLDDHSGARLLRGGRLTERVPVADGAEGWRLEVTDRLTGKVVTART